MPVASAASTSGCFGRSDGLNVTTCAPNAIAMVPAMTVASIIQAAAGRMVPTGVITVTTSRLAASSRTSAGAAWAADTQCNVPRTVRPSGALPPHDAGSQSACSSVTSPLASFTTPVHLTRQA